MSSLADLIRLPKSVQSESCADGASSFLSLSRTALKRGRLGGFTPVEMTRWLSLRRFDPYWIRPDFGTSCRTLQGRTQFLMWERSDGDYGLMLPLIAGDLYATLLGDSKGVKLQWTGAKEMPDSATLLYVTRDSDPFAMVQRAMHDVRKQLKTFRLRDDKVPPAFADFFGWCTWDAFYHDIDHDKVMAGLKSFQEKELSPGFVILDDGWQDYTGDHLNSLTPDQGKFPNGLGDLIREAKDDYGVKLFQVWHAFQGYWAGVNPNGELAREYRTVPNQGKIRPWMKENDKALDLNLIAPEDVMRFYHDFYRILAEQGVDGVKVDGQGALEIFTEGKLGQGSTMRTYQEALQTAAAAYFNNNLIHCMCNSTEVAYNMFSSVGWRNTNDYMPKSGIGAQQWHVFMNAMNNLWTSTFSLPDWDMFQTHGASAEFHAAARALSGGPVYVCDKPNEQNFKIIRKLCISGGRTLRPDRPALPSKDRLFEDCHHSEEKLMKITNRCGTIGLIGLFHCKLETSAITDQFRPRDIHDLDGKKFIAYYHNSGDIHRITRKKRRELTLNPGEFELVTFAPLKNGFAPLGLLDKYVGAAAIKGWIIHRKKTLVLTMVDGGRLGVYCAKKPKRVTVNGEERKFKYRDSGLLTVSIRRGTEASVVIE